MVGDFDPAAVEAKIRARFSGWQGRGAAGADPDIGDVDYDRAAAADDFVDPAIPDSVTRSEEHTSEPQSLMRNSSSVFCLKKKTNTLTIYTIHTPLNYIHSCYTLIPF